MNLDESWSRERWFEEAVRLHGNRQTVCDRGEGQRAATRAAHKPSEAIPNLVRGKLGRLSSTELRDQLLNLRTGLRDL
jgi:hypothetical protein